MKVRVYNETVDVTIEGENEEECFKKFVDQYPEEQYNVAVVKIVEPQGPPDAVDPV